MSNVLEKSFGQGQIFLKDADDRLLPATVELGCKDWNDNGRHRECRITLRWADSEITCADWNFFQCFKRVREQLALQHIHPICYGSSRKIIITGMAADMGNGLKVYKAELGNFPSLNQLVNIFDTGTDVEPVPVEVQEEFQRQWVQSIRKGR